MHVASWPSPMAPLALCCLDASLSAKPHHSALMFAALIIGPSLSSPRQEYLGLLNLRPLRIGVSGEIYELDEILRGLRPIADRIGCARGSPDGAVAVGRLPQRGLVLLQGRRGLGDLQQQLRQHFAQRIEAVLHDHVLEAAVLAVSGGTHESYRLIALTLLHRDPCRYREHLLLGAVGPI